MMATLNTTEEPACLDADTDAFFPADHESRAAARRRLTRAAQTYCARCPIQAECRADAERFNLEGLFGGAWRHRHSHNRLTTVDLLADLDDTVAAA